MQLIVPVFLAMFFFVLQGRAQSYSYSGYFGAHSYQETDTVFISKVDGRGYMMIPKVYAKLGRNKSRGYLILELRESGSVDFVVGNIVIITNKGNRIICRERNIRNSQKRDGVQVSSSLYYLTFKELSQLESDGIERIVFSTQYDPDGRFTMDPSEYSVRCNIFFK